MRRWFIDDAQEVLGEVADKCPQFGSIKVVLLACRFNSEMIAVLVELDIQWILSKPISRELVEKEKSSTHLNPSNFILRFIKGPENVLPVGIIIYYRLEEKDGIPK